SSPNPCTTAAAPNVCPDTTPGASNTITLNPSTDGTGQYAPNVPLNVQPNIAGTSLTLIGPQTANAAGNGAIVSGTSIVCGACPFTTPDTFDIQSGSTVTMVNLDVRQGQGAGSAVDSQGRLTIENSSFTQNTGQAAVFNDGGSGVPPVLTVQNS